VRFALKVDNRKCWGCRACEVACKQEHKTPKGVKLIRVHDEETREVREGGKWMFTVTFCRHCEEPDCVPVCPVDAITKEDDGIVVLDRDKCIGCGSCADACPHDAISAANPGDPVWKCNMCVNRVRKGLIPACADNVCLAHCIYFGDFRHIDEMIEKKEWLEHRIAGTLGSMVIRVDEE
jgi:tetrathionate reductase subunit B